MDTICQNIGSVKTQVINGTLVINRTGSVCRDNILLKTSIDRGNNFGKTANATNDIYLWPDDSAPGRNIAVLRCYSFVHIAKCITDVY